MHLKEISASIQSGNIRVTEELIAKAIREKHKPVRILREGLAAGIMEMQKRHQREEILDSELRISERAFKAGLHLLELGLETGQSQYPGAIVIGTAEGDIRETEKDLASCLMRSLGLRVIDLGTSVPNAVFIDAAIDEKARIIACAVSLTSFMSQIKALVQAAGKAKIRSRTKILLTGSPVTEWFCRCIDADIYAPDPIKAADMAAEHCGKCLRQA